MRRVRTGAGMIWWLRRVFGAVVPAVMLSGVRGDWTATVTPREACQEFLAPERRLHWTFEQCTDVWRAWTEIHLPGLNGGYPDRDIFRETSNELRRRGHPCVVMTQLDPDGAGSTSIRQLAAWMYAKEMGCNWVAPSLIDSRYNRKGSNETIFCHATATPKEIDDGKTPMIEIIRRCEYVSWRDFFAFNLVSTELPRDTIYNNIKVQPHDSKELQEAVDKINAMGWDKYPIEERLRLYTHPSMASRYVISIGAWDARLRAIAREVLQEFRTKFHQHPRPGYLGPPECHYSPSRLNIAIHIRMGDRRGHLTGNQSFFVYLDEIMAKVDAVVVAKGQPHPLFHVFSEAVQPCPALQTRSFAEFPAWKIGADEVLSCRGQSASAKPPEDCAEKRAGFTGCRGSRRDIFRVEDRPLILHLGVGVAHSLSCMIQADVILMGCSTFGQITGILTSGIRLFSTACQGPQAASQYRMIPPLAVAERGHMWVPVNGSWRNPVLVQDEIFDTALEELLRSRGV